MPKQKSEQDLSAKKNRIIDVAKDVFLRYGLTRTTMGDIADAAGISRPALYLVFPRKEEIFAAVIERLNDDQLHQFHQALPRLHSLDRRLHFCCGEWGAHGFDLVRDHPDAKDLFNLSLPPVQQMYTAFIAFVSDLLAGPLKKASIETTPEELARNLVFSMRGLKETATDGDHMRRMIALQVDLVLAALNTG